MTRFYRAPHQKKKNNNNNNNNEQNNIQNQPTFGIHASLSVPITSNVYTITNHYNGTIKDNAINRFTINASFFTTNYSTNLNNTICFLTNGILPYSQIISNNNITVTNSTIITKHATQNTSYGYDYYITLNYDTNTIYQYGLGLFFPKTSDITNSSISPTPVCFSHNDVVYIIETTFPYPVIVWDNCDIDIYFVRCTFTNGFISCTNGPSLNTNTPLFTQFTTQQDFLLSLNKTTQTNLGNYYFIDNTNFNIPSVHNRDFWPLQIAGASTVSNSGQFYLNLTFDPSHGVANTNVSLFQIDNFSYSDTTDPILQLSGNGNVSIVSAVDTFLTITNTSTGTVNILNSDFSRGVILDLTQGTGNINMENCKIFSPPLTSSNVYAMTTIGNNTKLGFINNSSIIWTGFGASYPWLTLDNSQLPVISSNTSFLNSVVSLQSSGRVDYVFSRAQNYSFSTIPYNAHGGNIVLSDSAGIYNLTDLKDQTTIRPLTNLERVFIEATLDKGYERAFYSKIKSPSVAPTITVDNITSQNGIGLYSTNSNLTVNNFTLSDNGINKVYNYLLTTGGNSNINLSGANYTMTLDNGKNFWNNAGNNVKLNNVNITYNLYGNVNIYNFVNGIEYEGPGSMYDQGVNLLDSVNSYKIHTDLNFVVNPLVNPTFVSSNIGNGITLTSLVSSHIVTINNSDLYNMQMNGPVYTGNLITFTGINTTASISNNNFYLRSQQFVTNNNTYLSGGSDSNYNLISSPYNNVTFIASRGTATRELEKQYGANLITNNGIYELANIVNDSTGPNVIFNLSVGTANVRVNNVNFPNQVNIYDKYSLGNANIFIRDSTLTRQGLLVNQPTVLNLTNSDIYLTLKNVTLTANNSSNLFKNFASANIRIDPDPVVYNLSATNGYYDLNVEPSFVNEIGFTSNGYYQINILGNKLTRQVTFHATGNQIFNIYASNSQILTTDDGNITQIAGDITAPANSPYALTLSGEGSANVLSSYPLILKTLNTDGDLLNIIGTNKRFMVNSTANITMPTTHRIPITGNISGAGNISIGITSFANSKYPYVYWPQLIQNTATIPFTSSNTTKYVATSWLPNIVSSTIVPYQFTKNSTYGNCSLSNQFIFGPQYTVDVNNNYDFTMAVASGTNDNLLATIKFDNADTLLPGAGSSTTDQLFDENVVSSGVVGYLNNLNGINPGDKLKSVTDSNNKYIFHYKLDKDLNNYYIGSLNANIQLSGSPNNSLYPDFTYKINDNTLNTFSLVLKSNGSEVSNIGIDTYNDIEAPINYEIITSSNRPIILPSYVYLEKYNGSIPVPDVKATYVGTSDNITNNGLVLTGSNINISNICGIMPNAPWAIDCEVLPSIDGQFTIFETRGDNNYVPLKVLGNKSSGTCNLSVIVNGTTYYNSNISLTTNLSSFYHPGITYTPNNFSSGPYGNVNTRDNSGGTLKIYGDLNGQANVITLSNYKLPNVSVSSLTLGTNLQGTIKNIRVSYVDLPGPYMANANVDQSNVETTIFFNSLINPTTIPASASNLKSIETPIFNSELITEIIISTPDSRFNNNHYYTYLRPNYLLGVNSLNQNIARNSFIKADNTTDNYWVSKTISAGIYFTSDFIANPSVTPLASNVAIIYNNTPNYLYPAAYIGYVPSGYSTITSNLITLTSGPGDFNQLNVNQSDYSQDFIFSIKMANLPDNGNANIYVYTDRVNNNFGMYFNFYDVIPGSPPTPGANLMTLTNINGNNIYAANVSLHRTLQQNYINKNNTKSFYVKTTIDPTKVTIGMSYRGNIIVHPNFQVEDYSSSLPFTNITNINVPTYDSIATYTYPVPFIISLGVGNTIVSPDISTYEPLITSGGNINQGGIVGKYGSPQYLFVSMAGSAPGNVVIPIQFKSNVITNLNIPLNIANINSSTRRTGNILNSTNLINTFNTVDLSGRTFNFFINKSSSISTNTAQVSITNTNRIWGDTTYTAELANLFVDGIANIHTNPIIVLPYKETNQRQITFSGIDNEFQYLTDTVTYADSNIVSNEISTSNITNITSVQLKTGIMSKEIRHGFTMSTNSIEHNINGSNVATVANLSFKLASTANVANTIPITHLVNVYDGNLTTSQLIPSKSITIDDYSNQLLQNTANIVYLDFNDVDFNHYGSQSYTLLNVYANIRSNIDPSVSDYGNHNNLLVWQLDFSDVSINYVGSLDYLIVGNWRFITNSDGTLLLQYKNNYEDSWTTKSCVSNLINNCNC